ncbi:MAG: 4Fe-4S binding protein [Candidatus Helarchaeota archaeon]
MIPSITRTIDKKEQKVKMKLMTTKIELTHDLEKCVGCNICRIVCPKEAIYRGPVGAYFRNQTGVPSVIFDHDKCSLCGTCDYMCPFGAISLTIDGEKILQLVEEKALPKLEIKLVDMVQEGRKAKSYLEGEIEFHEDFCPGGCGTCEIVCPTGAITYKWPKEGWEKTRKIEVDKDKCMNCGACVHACPGEGAIELKRTKVNYSGEFTDPFWPNIVKKLTAPLKSPIK